MVKFKMSAFKEVTRHANKWEDMTHNEDTKFSSSFVFYSYEESLKLGRAEIQKLDCKQNNDVNTIKTIKIFSKTEITFSKL